MSDSLEAAYLMLQNHIDNNDVLCSTYNVIRNVLDLLPRPEKKNIAATISCAAEEISYDSQEHWNTCVKITPLGRESIVFEKSTKTSGKSYEAALLVTIYTGLISAFSLNNKYNGAVEVRCDDRYVINLLNNIGREKASAYYIEKADGILDYCKQLPCKVFFVWRPEYFDKDTNEVNERVQS